jgi:hypothetical protein
MSTSPRHIIKPASVLQKKYDGLGKVINWSQLWPEAKELEALVTRGFADDLTPAQLCNKYPMFHAFAYRPLASALMSIRNRHNKEITNRAAYDACGADCECHQG